MSTSWSHWLPVICRAQMEGTPKNYVHHTAACPFIVDHMKEKEWWCRDMACERKKNWVLVEEQRSRWKEHRIDGQKMEGRGKIPAKCGVKVKEEWIGILSSPCLNCKPYCPSSSLTDERLAAPSYPPDTHEDTAAFSHVQTDMRALHLNTYTQMHRSPPAVLTTAIVLCSASLSIWLPDGGAIASCENYCTSAPIYMTLYKPRVGPAKVSRPTYYTW